MLHREVADKQTWNAFVLKHAPRSGAFLQTWEWGEFQRHAGKQVSRIGMFEKDDAFSGDVMSLAAQAIETRLPLGMRYLYVPRGPIPAGTVFDTEAYVEALRDLGQSDGALFMRFDPPAESAGPMVWKNITRTIDVQPSNTLITDLAYEEERLLDAMHQKTRYNIRLAEKKGVDVTVSGATFDEAWDMFKTTGFRGGFHLHPREYYEAMLKALSDGDCRAYLAVARYKGEALAANIMIDCGATRTYLHGASSDQHRNLMAPFLLHWRLMQDAAKQGIRWYDWWGIAPAGAGDNHPWAGITRFKVGFGGSRVSYPGTFDLVLQPAKYHLYQTARNVVRKMR